MGEWENANDLACLYLTQRKNRSAFSSNTISHKLLLTYLTTLCRLYATTFPPLFFFPLQIIQPERTEKTLFIFDTCRTISCHFDEINVIANRNEAKSACREAFVSMGRSVMRFYVRHLACLSRRERNQDTVYHICSTMTQEMITDMRISASNNAKVALTFV